MKNLGDSNKKSLNHENDFNDFYSDLVGFSDLRIIERNRLIGYSVCPNIFPIIQDVHNGPVRFNPLSTILYKCMAGYKFGNPKKLTCDIVMGLFLYGMSKLVNQKLYLVLGIFFKELRDCLNNNADQIIEKYTLQKVVVGVDVGVSIGVSVGVSISVNDDQNSSIDKKDFCSEKTPLYLPLIADIFVKHISSKYPDFELCLAVELIQDFCRWLEKKKLTKIRLSRAAEKHQNKICNSIWNYSMNWIYIYM